MGGCERAPCARSPIFAHGQVPLLFVCFVFCLAPASRGARCTFASHLPGFHHCLTQPLPASCSRLHPIGASAARWLAPQTFYRVIPCPTCPLFDASSSCGGAECSSTRCSMTACHPPSDRR